MGARIARFEWVRRRASLDSELYQRFGIPLEARHDGDFVAISDDGRTVIGNDELELTKQAIAAFGAGHFALRRIGYEAETRLRDTR